MAVLLVAMGVVVAVAAWHQVRRQAYRRLVADRHPPGPDGIVPGAAAIHLGRGGRGVLLLHGFGDTPQSLGMLAAHLQAGGWTVRAPLLAGHGRTLDALAATTAADWLASARDAWRVLRDECDETCLVGQSVGGALAVILSVEAPPPAALVLLAPYFDLQPGARWLGRFHRVVTPFVPFLRTRNAGSIRDPVARAAALGSGVLSPRLLFELDGLLRRARGCAPALRPPTLVLHSRHDPRISVVDAESSFATIGATEKQLRWFDRSAHVISADHDRELVAGEVLRWMDAAAGRGPGALPNGGTG